MVFPFQYLKNEDPKKFMIYLGLALLVIINVIFFVFFLPSMVKPKADLAKEASAKQAVVKAEPVKVKGIYLSGWTIGIKQKKDEWVALTKTTQLNTFVIDVKEDLGYLTFKPENNDQNFSYKPMMNDPKALIKELNDNGIYTIARIVSFKDKMKCISSPELAIKDKKGNVWHDSKKMTWLNPYNEKSWEYLVQIAMKAKDLGFKEVQFDYVRFPTDGDTSKINYGTDMPDKSQAIKGFLSYAKKKLGENIRLSADIFGIAAISEGDATMLGQRVETIADGVDALCPMVYPSHYANKAQNGQGQMINNTLFDKPDLSPYEVVHQSLIAIKDKISKSQNPNVIVRPYLQDFTARWLGKNYYMPYTKVEVDAQIKAAHDLGYEEFILWNSDNQYSSDVFLSKTATK